MLDENAAKTIWLYKLVSLFNGFNDTIHKNTHKRLELPVFSIDEDMGRKWGEWREEGRILRLNVVLFKQYEWGAVERVLQHEMGHMVNREIFGYVGNCSHGEHWKLACQALGMKNPTRCEDPDFLAGLKGQMDCPIADRIRKLLVKGSDGSTTKEESQLFLNKAQELMMRHQITMKDLVGAERLFVKRPVGMGYHGKSFPAWMGQLGLLLARHYSVNAITTYTWNTVLSRTEKYLELFGMPDDVEVAEYAFYAIYNNGLALFEKAKSEHKRKLKEDEDYKVINSGYSYRAEKVRAKSFTENSFMMGLISEFSRKLEIQQEIVEEAIDRKMEVDREIRGESEEETYAMIHTKNKELMDEMYGKAYGRVRTIPCNARAKGEGYYSGRAAGRNFSLSQGVKSGGNAGRLIGG